MSQISAPKVIDLKIVGHLRENNKVTATGAVTGGTEGLAGYRARSCCFLLTL
ncbi:hypothetical protein C1H46_018905 [Malus baccata]|uniref:Uncharacterized protein n=1 Tax=Malus baccata TaxID=106549 RepID=A0A540M9R3_MALBA|nr:hypothetical protein C1H46_018905 [Malus baccata]